MTNKEDQTKAKPKPKPTTDETPAQIFYTGADGIEQAQIITRAEFYNVIAGYLMENKIKGEITVTAVKNKRAGR